MRNSSICENVKLLGVNISNIDSTTLNELINHSIKSNEKRLFLHVNVYAINLANKFPWFKDLLNKAHIVFCDGDGVRLGSRIQGKKIKEKITYNRWIWDFAAFSQKNGISWFLVGSQEGIIESAVIKLNKLYPKLKISGHRNGYFYNIQQYNELFKEMHNTKPDVLILGMGMPIQETFLKEHYDDLTFNVALTGGAVFDYISGKAKMTPNVFYKLKLEWFYRFLNDPVRLFNRYFIGNPKFFVRILLEKMKIVKY